MKKNIVLLLFLTVVPYLLCVVFSLFSDNIHIGRGGNALAQNLMGKDVLIEINGLYKNMDVEEYVVGVLPGIISAEYDEEALKAQAILIRTNVLKEMEEKGTSDTADLSYEYLTVDERVALFGERNYDRYEERYERAVVDTAGLVLRKESSLIMAMYHEVSVGSTASAKEVLGEDVSYLQSVESSQDVEAKHYMNVIYFSWAELQDLEGQKNASKSEGTVVVKPKIAVLESTENGFVIKISVNDNIYTGEDAMVKYNLSSTNFYVEEMEDGIRFVCLGKGNCLGLSQYGANYMAQNGADYKEIINYYYTKISLEKY